MGDLSLLESGEFLAGEYGDYLTGDDKRASNVIVLHAVKGRDADCNVPWHRIALSGNKGFESYLFSASRSRRCATYETRTVH
jgi:hypothetical protein